MQGRIAEANVLLDRLLAVRNDLGLLSGETISIRIINDCTR
jgi:hypothetical protein